MAVADGHRLKNFDIRQAFTFSDAIKPLYIHLIYVKLVSITQNAVKEKVQVTLPERKRCNTGNVMQAERG